MEPKKCETDEDSALILAIKGFIFYNESQSQGATSGPPNATRNFGCFHGIDSGTENGDVLQYIYTIQLAIVCAAWCIFGILTNVINIVIFVKMGFKETVNIALLSLAISDLCSLISLLWLCICFNPLFMYSDIPILTYEIQHKTGGWTHFIFARVTGCLTVYITLERCLCIAFPLKVKSLLTPKRVFAITISIYIVVISSLGLNYTNFKLTWKFVPRLNRTMLGMVYNDLRDLTQTITYVLNIFYIVIAFTGVITCSSVLIWKLNQRSKWLDTKSSGQAKSATTARDSQVIKMVLCVAILFIISFTPSVMFFLAISIEPEINVGKKYNNLFQIFLSTIFTFDAINSSVNIFIYYKMSSKYVLTLRSLISR